MKPIGLHEARHTYVSLMYMAGCSLEEIGDYVGHSSTYMTDRYRHLLPHQRKQAAERLDAVVSPYGAHRGAHPRLSAVESG
jgi:integrase